METIAPPTAPSAVRVAELLAELEQEAPTTRRVLERVPDAHLDWRPHERSYSLGQLAMHVASIPGAIAELARAGMLDARQGDARPGAASTAEVLATFDASVARARELLGAMDDALLGEPWRLVDGDRVLLEITRGALLRTIMLNHAYHHRGQLTVYLRQTGASVPAVYGPSADELPVFF